MSATTPGHGSLLGNTVGGYAVEALIGRGAMGTVYLARDIKLNRKVALKVLLGSLARNPDTVKQFHREAQAAAPLKHPSIVRIYSAGIEHGTPYIAMEFIDGEPLDRFLKRKGMLKWQHAFHIAGQVALALDCAHRHGIVHRDIKPSNIMLDKRGVVRLTDFGIANVHSDDAAGPEVVGTPQYMSPEQCTGGEVGPASDLFSLGVTIYQMIAGELPFKGESSMALIRAICTEDPPRLNRIDRTIPDDVARLVAYLMEKKPEMRPANARVVNALINRVQEQKGGASAMPEALTAFVKEQTQSRTFGTTPAPRRRETTRANRSTRVASLPWRTIRRWALIGAMACAALLAGPILGALAREGRTEKAPTIEMGGFRSLASGITSVQVFAEGFEFTGLGWLGNESLLIVRADGIPGTRAYGASGLLAIDPAARRITSLRAPTGPATDARAVPQPRGVLPSFPATPSGTPLNRVVLVHAQERPGAPVYTLAQRFDAAAPSPAVLFSAPPERWYGTTLVPWLPGAVGRALVHPTGETLCLVLYDPETGSDYIVERHIRARPPDAVGPRRTSVRPPIVPESVQYTPDGGRIAYLRAGAGSESNLYVMRAGSNERDGRLLVSGVLGNHVAFSPSGRYCVARLARTAGGPYLALIDVADGRIIADLGPGSVSPEAWRPGEDSLVVCAPETVGGPRQLWAVAIGAPGNRVQLTRIRDGVGELYAVSRDGTWIAAVANGDGMPGLVLMEWDRLGIDTAP